MSQLDAAKALTQRPDSDEARAAKDIAQRKSSILYRGKVRRVIGSLLRNRRFQLRGLEKPFLNLGCGGNFFPDFIGLDYGWIPGLDLCWDLRRGIPFPDSCFEGIYSEHTFEHIPFDSFTKSLLPEIKRVLKPGGTLRIVVPDAELFCVEYARTREGRSGNFFDPNESLTPMQRVNHVFRFHGEHQFAWDYETLAKVLREAGFGQIERTTHMRGRDARLLVDLERRAWESLYVEAVK